MITQCEECGSKEFSVLIGFVADGIIDAKGNLTLGKMCELDDTCDSNDPKITEDENGVPVCIEAITCVKCGNTYEKLRNVINEYIFPPVIINVTGGIADVDCNPTFYRVVIRNYDVEGEVIYE